MLQYKPDFNKLEWVHPIEGVKCKIIKNGNQQLRLIDYRSEMPPHWCEGLALDGELEIEFQNDTHSNKQLKF